jgi:hypothetical protein
MASKLGGRQNKSPLVVALLLLALLLLLLLLSPLGNLRAQSSELLEHT